MRRKVCLDRLSLIEDTLKLLRQCQESRSDRVEAGYLGLACDRLEMLSAVLKHDRHARIRDWIDVGELAVAIASIILAVTGNGQ